MGIVFILFVVLLMFGIGVGELSWLNAGAYVLVAVGCLAAIVAFQWTPGLFFVLITGMDIVLVLVIFKGDIRIR